MKDFWEKMEIDLKERGAKANRRLKGIPRKTITSKNKAMLADGLALIVSKEQPLEDRLALLKRIEEMLDQKTPEEPKQPTFAAMLNSVIDWKMDRLRKELTTPDAIPWIRMKEAEAWLAACCPQLYFYAPRLEKAKMIERTQIGFNMKLGAALFATLLRQSGFQDWKAAGKYFTLNGKPVNVNSLKNQAHSATWPRGWESITSILPEVAQRNR